MMSGIGRRPLERRKGREWQCPQKSLNVIVSKVDALVKDFADLKVHVVGGQDRRKSPSRLRANLWCTTCGKVAHANTECTNTRPNYPVNAVEWVSMWETVRYYTDAVEETAYGVQEAPASYPIPPAHIPRYATKDMATTVPQRRIKDDVQVNQVTLSPEKVRHDEALPYDEVMVGKVET
ncbi:hypothetical protein AXG93_4846s1160 [Marchantia polymorpha subsp. ruderalis]|uniref:CCHC-type domain-containing protein n=1 Tax=Marchantia polymorpha subsp. ruderalis TaxID=1480154 RepID=A0A176VFM4_MARPO|nr:hypothetical protein AXG93_4846s1160 [Marchantia polymorpha subsp. ruderalis]